MNTLHLKYAVEVERTGSITQAADNLYMGQPNLSKAIRELEDQMGIVIFKRSSRGVVPTRKGTEFLRCAKRILAQIDEMEMLYRSEPSNRQRISVSAPRGSYISHAFSCFIGELDQAREIEADFNETSSVTTISRVSEGASNLGIIRYQTIYEEHFMKLLKDKGLITEPVWEYESLALMSRNHPLAQTAKLKSEQLDDCVELVHGDSGIPYLSGFSQKRDDRRKVSAKRITIYERGSQFDLLTEIPSTYMWVSPVPETTLRRYDLVQRRCECSDNKYKDMLIYANDYTLSEYDRGFIRTLFRVRDELAARQYA